MIRSIEVHTGEGDFVADVSVIEHPKSGCAVLRIHTGGATVNVFGSSDRVTEIRRAAAVLNEAFGDEQIRALQEAAE
jgi:hypothetical protein